MLLPVYQIFLKIENHRLWLRHQAGGGGREVCAARAALIDILLRNIFAAASEEAPGANGDDSAAPVSLVALGGYGRGELNPGSDVDVMFLVAAEKDILPTVAKIIEQVLYFLWDIGLKVGHSTRSIREAVTQANGEMPTKTSMLEARHLAGDPELYRAFRAQFRQQCVQGYEKDYLGARMDDQALRHDK